MKRPASDNDARRPSCSSSRGAKRYKPSCPDVRASRACSSPPLHPSSQTPPLTQETLHSTQPSTLVTSESLLQHWVEDCTATSDPDIMAAPPTPRSAALGERGRRNAKRHARSHGSRTPSPSKRLSLQTYRTRNMHHAGVFVDSLAELPPVIDGEVRQILELDSWDDQVAASVEEVQATARFNGLVMAYLAESQRNARECSLEGDWRASLNGLVRNLADFWPGTLKTQMSEKIWHPSLKPTGPSLDEFQSEDYSGTRTPRSAPAQTAFPDYDPSAATVNADTFTGPIPSLPPYTQSVASTTSTEAADPYHITTPKPDITIGLAHTTFMHQHQRRLVDHQASESILSDPHAADMGIRFPFLVVEAKGLSLNGSLVGGQNQAAISGASMLTILKDLHDQAASNVDLDHIAKLNALDPQSTSSYTALSVHESTPRLCFSIVTEGPAHELWVHFEHEGAFHMYCIQSWRTTRERDTREFARYLLRVMKWGTGRFKEWIVERVDRVPRYGAFG